MKFLEFSNGDKMPALGLGTWKSAKGEVYAAVRTAIKQGYKHFDCAYIYGNEAEIGDAFADAFTANEVKREELWVTSKLWNNSHRAEQVLPAIQRTLKDLKLDYLDLYLIHWPVVIVDDKSFPASGEDLVSLSQTPLTETWKEMVELKNKGLTRHVGVSNFSINKLEAIISDSGIVPEVNQIESHLFMQQTALKNYMDSKGIFITAYCPLGSSDRPANRIADDEPKLFDQQEVIAIAEELGCTAAQVMLAWAVERGTSVIPKSVNENRLKQNLEAADIDLSARQMARLAAIDIKYRYIKGDFWCLPGSDYTFENLWEDKL
jgi:alcohol dehydrogenase (NADP+)